MATHDFTLEDIHKLLLGDIRTVVREEVDASFDRKFGPAFNAAFEKSFTPAFDKAFKLSFTPAFESAFNKSFSPAFDASFEPHAEAIQGDFNQINTRLDRLDAKTDTLVGLKRIVGQHSKEIIDLRSRLA